PSRAISVITANYPVSRNMKVNTLYSDADTPRAVAVSTPSRMKPTWLMDEYAIIRFTSRCMRATTAPTSRLSTASAQMIGCQSARTVPKDETNTRSKAAKAPALATAAMNPATGDGEPSYTSGDHMWNGTAAILNPKPTSSRARPASSTPFEAITFLDRESAIWGRLLDPVAP